MAVTHPTQAVRQGMTSHVTDQLNSGSIEIQAAGAVALATMAFQATAYGAPNASAQATANGLPLSDTDANAGTAVQAQQKNSGGTVIVECGVSSVGGQGEIQLSSVAIGAGDTVTLTDLTYETSD